MTLPEIPRWPKRSLLWDPDEEERALKQLNDSRRSRGLEPFGRELLSDRSGDPDLAPIVEKGSAAPELVAEEGARDKDTGNGPEDTVIYETDDSDVASDAKQKAAQTGDQIAGTAHRDGSVKFVVNSKGDAGGGRQEHLGPDGHPHIHLKGKGGQNEVKISSRTLEPLDPKKDGEAYNRHYRKMIDRLTPEQRADIARKADNLFYRGAADTDAPKVPKPEPSRQPGGRMRGGGGGGGGGGLPGGIPFKGVKPFDPKS